MSRSSCDGRTFSVLCRLVLACVAFWSPSPWETRQQRRARERREAKEQTAASSVPGFVEAKPLSKKEKKRMKKDEKRERRRLKKERKKARDGVIAPPSTPTDQSMTTSIEGVLECDKETVERGGFVDIEMTLVGTKPLNKTVSELYLETQEVLGTFDSKQLNKEEKNVTVRLSSVRVQILEAMEWGEAVLHEHMCEDVALFMHISTIFGYVVKERHGKYKLICLKAPTKSSTADCDYQVPRIFEAFRNSGAVLSEDDFEAPGGSSTSSKKKPAKDKDPWGEADSSASFCTVSTFTIRTDNAGSEFSLGSGSMDEVVNPCKGNEERKIKSEPAIPQEQPDTGLKRILSAPKMQAPPRPEHVTRPRPQGAHHRSTRGRPYTDNLPGGKSEDEFESTTVVIPLPRNGSVHSSTTFAVTHSHDDVTPKTMEETFTLPGQVEDTHDEPKLESISTVVVLPDGYLIQSRPASAKSSTPQGTPSPERFTPTPDKFERMPTFFTGALPLSASKDEDDGHSVSQHDDAGSDVSKVDGASPTSSGVSRAENGDLGVPVSKCANHENNATSWAIPHQDTTDDDSDNAIIGMFQTKFEDCCDAENESGYQNLQSSSF